MLRSHAFTVSLVVLGVSLLAWPAVQVIAQQGRQASYVAKDEHIEPPAKQVVKNTSGALASTNPKVPPGRVSWHSTFDNACDAARKSGKPVLLFQMMGKLDQQFC
jgi:hypothetical protein